ncbi:hypothetical protein KIN20_021595 [Parelaphostrongylus tenuis]|uniref:Uncharacterized protein n=1 Tax=Parelaphostrongylus tenuis TaxID=148309 RepID=A0AAD5MP42_PARTN|nr:hypothetical protein KIN20_021595 [Parelaphostrongylus tenuis]
MFKNIGRVQKGAIGMGMGGDTRESGRGGRGTFHFVQEVPVWLGEEHEGPFVESPEASVVELITASTRLLRHFLLLICRLYHFIVFIDDL